MVYSESRWRGAVAAASAGVLASRAGHRRGGPGAGRADWDGPADSVRLQRTRL